jgi:hypothetical protein
MPMKPAKEIQPGDKIQLANGTWAKVKANHNSGMLRAHRMLELDCPYPEDWAHVPYGSELEVA